MPAYVIVETDVSDPEQYEQYKTAASAAVTAHGGRYLVRGGEQDVLEGDWRPSRLVVLEFADLAAARRWYDSEHAVDHVQEPGQVQRPGQVLGRPASSSR